MGWLIVGFVAGVAFTAFAANRKPQWFASIQTIVAQVGDEVNKYLPPSK